MSGAAYLAHALATPPRAVASAARAPLGIALDTGGGRAAEFEHFSEPFDAAREEADRDEGADH